MIDTQTTILRLTNSVIPIEFCLPFRDVDGLKRMFWTRSQPSLLTDDRRNRLDRLKHPLSFSFVAHQKFERNTAGCWCLSLFVFPLGGERIVTTTTNSSSSTWWTDSETRQRGPSDESRTIKRLEDTSSIFSVVNRCVNILSFISSQYTSGRVKQALVSDMHVESSIIVHLAMLFLLWMEEHPSTRLTKIIFIRARQRPVYQKPEKWTRKISAHLNYFLSFFRSDISQKMNSSKVSTMARWLSIEYPHHWYPNSMS